MIPDKVYDYLKWICLICLPAIAWFINTISPYWGWQNTEAIVATINALGTLVGILIGVSTVNYNKQKDDTKESDKKEEK